MTLRKSDVYLIICVVLSCVILTSCGDSQTDENIPQANIHIEKIIDKESRLPLEYNTITLRWETPEGEVISTEQYEGESSLSTSVIADGNVRLFITVEAPGYKTWENAMRMNWSVSRPVYITVEMELEEGLQG